MKKLLFSIACCFLPSLSFAGNFFVNSSTPGRIASEQIQFVYQLCSADTCGEELTGMLKDNQATKISATDNITSLKVISAKLLSQSKSDTSINPAFDNCIVKNPANTIFLFQISYLDTGDPKTGKLVTEVHCSPQQ